MNVASSLENSQLMLPFCVNVFYFFSLEQPAINTVDVAIKSTPNTVGNQIFWGIHLPNLVLNYSNLSSRNDEGKIELVLDIFIILSFLLAETNTCSEEQYT